MYMQDKNSSIHEFDYRLIADYFSNLGRQGPGSPEVTLKALSFIGNLTPGSKIADLGCGSGGQTMVLAQSAPGSITAIDLFPEFIEMLNESALQKGLQDRVKGVAGSMDSLPFNEEELDLIWSEGAIYNIGFERGLKEWRRYLKPGGHIAVSEASWFRDDPPAEILDYWNSEYPGIGTVSAKLAQLEGAGYAPVAVFALPESCWSDHYYGPQTAAQEIFLQKHRGSRAAQELVASMRREAALYARYKAYYGYAFYIGRKTNQS